MMETETRKSRLEMHREQLKPMALHIHYRTPTVVLFRMKKLGTGMMSTQITFTPAGIALQGDFTPTDYGTCSTLGYGERWFSGLLSADYLAEKFLRKSFWPDLCRSELRDAERMKEMGINHAIARDMADLEDWELQYQIVDFISRYVDRNFDSATPGYGYNPGAFAALCAIQERFSQLHREMYPDGPPQIKAPEID